MNRTKQKESFWFWCWIWEKSNFLKQGLAIFLGVTGWNNAEIKTGQSFWPSQHHFTPLLNCHWHSWDPTTTDCHRMPYHWHPDFAGWMKWFGRPDPATGCQPLFYNVLIIEDVFLPCCVWVQVQCSTGGLLVVQIKLKGLPFQQST